MFKTVLFTNRRTLNPATSSGRNPSRNVQRDELISPFDSLADELFRELHTDLVKSFGATPFGKAAYPKVDVIEYPEHVEVVAELAGMKRDDISVEIVDGQLVLSGENSDPTTQLREGGRYLRKELKRSNFVRTFTLGDQLDHESIEAQFSDGILTIKLPKLNQSEQPRSQRIEVK